ncbi:hypothetical protein RUM43_012574 [Polyplax serrata]|uniref:G-protein coupled receptors family 1 profile domain-containing protein n=1 Tax=Polyplax serrata TaxID=468196 RepID=A0AAN8RYR9_POLSC
MSTAPTRVSKLKAQQQILHLIYLKKSQKFVSCNDESDCMERSYDGDEKYHHHSIIKSTSLSNSDHSQYTTTTSTTAASIHQQRSIRSHQSHYSYQNNHSMNPEFCGQGTRLNYYSGGSVNRSSRPQSLTVDLESGENACGLKYNSSSRVSSFRRESKTTQTLTIVVGGFVACWLPFFVLYLITPFLPECTVPGLLMSFLTWLGWFNSAINPFIYAFYSVDFRTAFWRLTFRHCTNTQKWQQQFRNRNK